MFIVKKTGLGDGVSSSDPRTTDQYHQTTERYLSSDNTTINIIKDNTRPFSSFWP